MSFCLQWHVLNVECCWPLILCPRVLRQLKQPVFGAVFCLLPTVLWFFNHELPNLARRAL